CPCCSPPAPRTVTGPPLTAPPARRTIGREPVQADAARRCAVRTYLVLAHKTLLGGPLLEALRERAARAPSRFHLVVPMEVPSGATWTEGQVRRAAEERLAAGLEQLGAAGLEVTGEVGDGRPVDAVQQVLLRGDLSIDEIIVSTL